MKVKIWNENGEALIYDSTKVAIAVFLTTNERNGVESGPPGPTIQCSAPSDHLIARDDIERALFMTDGFGDPRTFGKAWSMRRNT